MNQVAITKEEFEGNLKTSVVDFKFTKKDGTVRTAKGTLLPQFLPPLPESNTDTEPKRQKAAPNPDLVTYWDLEAVAWRSFSFASIDAASVSTTVPVPVQDSQK